MDLLFLAEDVSLRRWRLRCSIGSFLVASSALHPVLSLEISQVDSPVSVTHLAEVNWAVFRSSWLCWWCIKAWLRAKNLVNHLLVLAELANRWRHSWHRWTSRGLTILLYEVVVKQIGCFLELVLWWLA